MYSILGIIYDTDLAFRFLYSNIFAKPLVPQERKEEEATEKNNVKFGEGSIFSKLGDKPTNIFGTCSAEFGQNFGNNSSIFGGNLKTDANSSNFLSARDDNTFSSTGLTDNKPIFGMGGGNVLGSGAPSFGSLDTKFQTVPATIFQRKDQEQEEFKFKVPAPTPSPPPLETEEKKEEVREKKKLETDEERELKEKLDEEEENRLRDILIEAMRKSKEEAQKREREKKKAEEEEERKILEEKRKLEELERQEKLRRQEMLKMEEMKRIEEENKRKSVAVYK